MIGFIESNVAYFVICSIICNLYFIYRLHFHWWGIKWIKINNDRISNYSYLVDVNKEDIEEIKEYIKKEAKYDPFYKFSIDNN